MKECILSLQKIFYKNNIFRRLAEIFRCIRLQKLFMYFNYFGDYLFNNSLYEQQ